MTCPASEKTKRHSITMISPVPNQHSEERPTDSRNTGAYRELRSTKGKGKGQGAKGGKARTPELVFETHTT